MFDLFNINNYPLNLRGKYEGLLKNKSLDVQEYDEIQSPDFSIFEDLLKDRTTGKNILFATDTYSNISPNGNCKRNNHITLQTLMNLTENNNGIFVIQPRVCKSLDEQKSRTKKSAEVFTPTWICNKMNNYCDIEWFNNEFQDKVLFDVSMNDYKRNGIFNKEIDENGQHSWKTNTNKILFSPISSWETYVKSTRLEITCGEAPFIVSRYDVTTGKLIEIKDRIGLLDRKLRIINENVEDDGEWFNYVCNAYKSVYGYEFQGDNLLIARINLLLAFVEYYTDRFGIKPTDNELEEIVDIITWNFWQMDGLTNTIPYGKIPETSKQTTLDFFTKPKCVSYEFCKIRDWFPENGKGYIELRINRLY